YSGATTQVRLKGSVLAGRFATRDAHVADLLDERLEQAVLFRGAATTRRLADQREHAAREVAFTRFERSGVQRLRFDRCSHPSPSRQPSPPRCASCSGSPSGLACWGAELGPLGVPLTFRTIKKGSVIGATRR